MEKVQTEKDLEKVMEKVVSRVLPRLLREMVNNIRTGTVVNVAAKTIDARVNGTGDVLTGVRFQSGASTPSVGSQVMLISPDPSLKSQVKAIIF